MQFCHVPTVNDLRYSAGPECVSNITIIEVFFLFTEISEYEYASEQRWYCDV